MDVLKKLNIANLNSGASTGKWWSPITKTKPIVSYNPANEAPIAQVSPATKADYEKIIIQAQKGFEQWREVPAPKRGEVIRLIAEELRKYKDELGTLISIETGKIKSEGNGEVQEMIDIADFAVGESRMLYGRTMPSERPHHRMYEQWLPLGPIGVITTFNFPVAVWAWNAFIAAICGDTVIWKPSPKTPLCAIAVQHICNRVLEKQGYEGIFSLFIPEKKSLIETMVSDSRLPLISFTGSTSVGRQVSMEVAKRLGRSILELSGNNAVIVDETADLSLVIPAVLFGAVGTAGQRCTTIRRLIVHESRYQEVAQQLISAYQQIKIGDPLAKHVLMGPLIDADAVEQFSLAIHEIKKQGGEILTGGNVLKSPGYFVEPTIAKVKHNWAIVQKETFAPILYVIPYKKFADAVAMQNDTRQGLSSALFSQDFKHVEYFLSELGSDCGIANINIGTSGAEIGGAFGGEKETGGGREAGSDAWKYYMRRQTVTINWSDELPLAQGVEFE